MKIHFKNDIIEIKNNINIYGIKNMIYKKYGISHNHQYIFVNNKFYNNLFLDSKYDNSNIIIIIRMI